MASPAELLAEAASALVRAAAAMPASQESTQPVKPRGPKTKPKAKAGKKTTETELKSPKSYRGSSFKDFPRLVEQMRS